ncbi:unnamed protein product [Darwinula stevensoni]|uniref:Large ribosomal subunit protein mL50 n=1 Tax=Darwinula stevensoni TaxID=69355 RepID=A0A7R8XHQ5_9CRUS|nr:unnamed protein product [Darwinula stevensoni]CAG0892739.1 unnamed protein product [Darwinula stevensoni]
MAAGDTDRAMAARTATSCLGMSRFYPARTFSTVLALCQKANGSVEVQSGDPGLEGHRKVQFDVESLQARGFLRNQRSYDPPPDVASQLLSISQDALGSRLLSEWSETPLADPHDKYALLTHCARVLGHVVPNSMLHQVSSLGDVLEFYKTPVVTKNPYELLQEKDLPKNLHVIPNPVRFHPDTDTLFKGQTAFPGRSTVSKSLRYKKRYPGYDAQPLPRVFHDN